MWQATALWSLAPNEVEAALAFRGIDIGWWHRWSVDADGFPRLSSRRLLALLNELPETCGYKTILRDGGWPAQMKMLAEIHKEMALYRASQYAGSEAEYAPMVFVDPLDAKRDTEKAKAEVELRDKTQKKLFKGLGWTQKGGE